MNIIDELRDQCRKDWDTDNTNHWDYWRFRKIVEEELIVAHEKIKNLEAIILNKEEV